jgi:regulator of cell morphogenesis and NO signaling
MDKAATAADRSSSDRDGHAAWQSQPPTAIIDFILTRFHEPLRRDLPGLVERARQVETAECPQALCPVGLAVHLGQVRVAVESHLAKEEKILFPLILAGRGSLALMPIRVLMSEHDDHQENLLRTRSLTHEFALPATASSAWRALYDDLQSLEAELTQHIDLENNVLFTRVMGADAR